MKKLFLLLMTVVLASAVAMAQNRTVSGTVVSAADDEPLPGASVQPVGGGVGVATDLDGNFTISVPKNVTKLTVSYIGMVAQTVDITSGKMLIKLDKSETNLDEVMVVAYGTAKKSAYTGSASVVKSAQIEDRMVSDVTNALVGTVAGVQATSSNGQPGTSANIFIRGIGSINASTAPLYVLDGVPYGTDISGINPADIESMTVLKDAAAAALYGARGANGVVLITTKQGSEGAAKVTFDARWGSNSRQVKNYDVVTDPRQYMEIAYASQYNAAIYNQGMSAADAAAYAASQAVAKQGYRVFTTPDGESLFTPAGRINPNAKLGYSDGTYYYTPDDWAKDSFRNGLRQEYNLSISGGGSKFNYYINGSYLKDEGIIENSSFERLSTRTAIDYQAKPWLKVGTNVSYSFTKSQYPDEELGSPSSMNSFYCAYNIAPIYPMYVRSADGTIMRDKNTGNPIYDYGTTTNARRPFMSEANPAGDLIYSTEEYLIDLFNGKWYAILTPIEGLTLTGNVNLLIDNTRYHNLASPLYGQNVADGGIATQYFSRTKALNLQGLANYRRTFAQKHNTEFLLGYESYSNNSESLQGVGKHLYQPDVWAINNTLKDANRTAYGSTGAYSTRGYFGRVNYDFDNRYFFSFSYRRDASSRFAISNRWGSFFAVSGAWDAAKESFMAPYKTWLDQLKLRASFGQQGNDGIGNYLYQDLYTISGATEWSDALSQKGNPDITWEKTNSFNVGIDYSFLQGKVYGQVEYFSRQVSNMLFMLPAAPSLGYPNVPTNFGKIRNYGLEIEVNYRPIETRDFTWDIHANATFINNKVIELPSIYKEDGYKAGRVVYREGESLYQWYLVKYAGVDKATGKALYWAWKNDENGKRIPGSDYVTDQYSTDWRQPTGDLLPTVYGGFGTTLKYKGFDLGLTFSYQLGGRLYDAGYIGFMGNGYEQNGQNWHKDIMNAWTPENPNSKIPRLDADDQFSWAGSTECDFAVTNSNYLALNNITFGYTLPKSLTERLKIDQIRIYGAADNVALWSARKGMDPRQSFTQANSSYYSPMRCISGGIKVVF